MWNRAWLTAKVEASTRNDDGLIAVENTSAAALVTFPHLPLRPSRVGQTCSCEFSCCNHADLPNSLRIALQSAGKFERLLTPRAFHV